MKLMFRIVSFLCLSAILLTSCAENKQEESSESKETSDSSSETGTEETTESTTAEKTEPPTPDYYFEFTLRDDGTYSIALKNTSVPTEIIIPATYNGTPVTAIADHGFFCKMQLETVVISEGITEIGENAFSGCTNLVSVKLPKSLLYINEGAFSSCRKLANILLHENIEYIGMNAFYDLPSLDDTAYSGASYLGCAENNYVILIKAQSEDITECDIPAQTKWIYDSAFTACTRLSKITLPDGLRGIGRDAFRSCDALTAIEIPDNVHYLGTTAFVGCDSLENVSIGNGIDTLSYTFTECKKLRVVHVGNHVSTIENAFENCISLTSVTFACENGWYTADGIPIDVSDAYENAVNLQKEFTIWKDFSIIE